MTLTLPRLLSLLALCALLQSRYNAGLPLSGDEAYYWVWSHTLQAGYHDHPPMIALLIKATTALFGDTVYGVRLVAALCMSGALFFIARMAERAYGGQSAWWALGFGFIIPLTQMGYVLATPDAPLVLFWSASAYFGMKALAEEGNWPDFLLAGLCAGAAMASKYTGVLVPASALLFVLIRRRDLLRSSKLWASVGVAALAFSPVLWWNYAHGFESFAFQYRHGSGGSGETVFLWKEFGRFTGGLVVAASPVLFVVMILALIRRQDWERDDKRLYLVTLFLAPMALFLYKALFTKIQLNWAAPAFLTLLPVAAGYVDQKRLKTVGLAVMASAALMAVALKWPLLLGLTGNLNIQNRLFGGEQAATAIMELRQPGDSVFADHLTRAALLQFYLPDHPRVMIPTESRYSEYTRWDQGMEWKSLHGLYLAKDQHQVELTRLFGTAELAQVVVASRPGFRSETFYLYRVGAQ